MNVPGNGGEDLLLVGSEACVLLDGQELAPRWTFGIAQVLRYGVCCGNACSCKPGTTSPPPQQPWGQGPPWEGVRGPECFCEGPIACLLVLPCPSLAKEKMGGIPVPRYLLTRDPL